MKNEEMKYRIKVEPINGNDEELDAEYRLGIDCQGFTIIADQGESNNVGIYKMSLADIACSIRVDDTLLEAAYIAIGMDQGRRAVREKNALAGAMKIDADMLRGLFGGGLGGDE